MLFRVALTLILLVLLVGCENIDVSRISDSDLERIADKAIVCNAPYMRFASGCCIDQDGNKICDIDEKRSSGVQQVPAKSVEGKLGIYQRECKFVYMDRQEQCTKDYPQCMKGTRCIDYHKVAYDVASSFDRPVTVTLDMGVSKPGLNISVGTMTKTIPAFGTEKFEAEICMTGAHDSCWFSVQEGIPFEIVVP